MEQLVVDLRGVDAGHGVGSVNGGTSSFGVDAFAGPGSDALGYFGVKREVMAHVNVSGIELALLNRENDEARKVIDSLT